MADVSVIFDADTGRYVANVRGMEVANTKAADSVAKAKNLIVQANREQIEAARAHGASIEVLERIQTKSANAMANVTEGSANKIIASMERIRDKQKRVQAELATLGKLEVPEHSSGGHGITDRMAASSLVRGLETGNVGIRTVENFITTLPGSTKLLQGFFAVAGPIAFAAAIGEGVKKFYEMRQALIKVPAEIANAYRETHLSAASANDDLQLTNDRLRNEVAILEHKPINALAIALDEDRVKADALATAMASAADRSKKLLEQYKISRLAEPFSGQQSTQDVADMVNKGRTAIKDAAFELQEATRSGDQLRIAQSSWALTTAKAKYRREVDADIKMRSGDVVSDRVGIGKVSYGTLHGKQDANLSILKGERSDLSDAETQEQEQSENAQLTSRKAALEGNKALTEAQQKAATLRMKAMEDELNQLKLNGNVTLRYEYEYWQERIATVAAGSAQEQEIRAKMVALGEQGGRKAAETIKEFKTRQKQQAIESVTGAQEVSRSIAEVNNLIRHEIGERDRARDARQDAANEVAAMQVRNAAALEEQRINEATGRSITRVDAARQLQLLHAQQYNAEMDRLNAKAVQVAGASYLTDAQKEEQLGRLRIDAGNLQTRSAEQAARDAQNVAPPATSAAVGAKDALDELADAAKDSAGQMREFIGGSLHEVNRAIMSGGWKSAGSSILHSAESTLLNKAEGTLLGAFGLGSKAPKGTASDPMNVRIVGGLDVPSITNSLPGSAEGWITKSLGTLLPGLPMMADGAENFSGGMAIVGERGPELVNLPKGSGVVPNSRLPGVGATEMHFHQDLRGATDAAQIRAAARQGAMEGHAAMASVITRKVTADVGRYPKTRRPF